MEVGRVLEGDLVEGDVGGLEIWRPRGFCWLAPRLSASVARFHQVLPVVEPSKPAVGKLLRTTSPPRPLSLP